MKIITHKDNHSKIQVTLHELFAIEIPTNHISSLKSLQNANISIVKSYKYSTPSSNVQKVGKKLFLLMATKTGKNKITLTHDNEIFQFTLQVKLSAAASAHNVSDEELPMNESSQTF